MLLLLGVMSLIEAKAQTATATYVTDPNPVTINQGASFSVLIEMEPSALPAPDIDAAAIHLDFDETLLEVTGLTTFEAVNNVSVILQNEFDNTTGEIDFSAGLPPPTPGNPTIPVPGTGSFLQIDLLALSTGSTSLQYVFAGFRQTQILRAGANLLTTPTNIAIEIGAAPTIPEITLDATATVDEGGTISVPISISDADGDNLTVSFSSTSNEPELLQSSNAGAQTDPFPVDAEGFYNLINIVDDGTGGSYTADLEFSPQFGDGGGANGDGSGEYTITVTVDDGSSGPVTQDLILTVNDVDQLVAGTGVTRIEAESFDNQGGGNGIGVEIFPTQTNIGFTNTGEFAAYEIDVATAGIYRLDLAVGVPEAAGSTTTKQMTISSDAALPNTFILLNTFTATGTGGFGTYVIQSINISLPAGPQTLKFDWITGSNFLFNIDYFDLEFLSATDNPPVLAAIDDVEASEGTTVSVPIPVADDFNPSASIVIYDKSISNGNTNTDPFTSGGTVSDTEYSFTENPAGSGNWTLEWVTGPGDGRSYLARVTADDGANPAVTEDFNINIAQPIIQTIAAKTFANPLPWYGANPGTGYSVAIENNGNQNIGYINSGEFVQYLIDVPAPGPYELRIAAATNDGTDGVSSTPITFSEEDGAGFNQVGDVSIPNLPSPSGWQSYNDYFITVVFTNAGVQTFQLFFGAGVNVLELEFSVSTLPYFTAELGDQSNFEGDAPVGLSVAATDPDGGSVTYSDGGTLPAGLSIDANTGEISGTIAAGAAAGSPYSVVITATDDDVPAEEATTTFSWNVATPLTTPICFNLGSQPDVTAFGRSFGDEEAYVTSFAGNFGNAGSPIEILGTLPGSGEEALFKSEKYGDPLSLQFPTGNGDFTVELYFAEIFVGVQNGSGAGARVFDIDVEGSTDNGIDLFDIYGPLQAATRTYAVTVTDGFLNIDLDATADNAKLSGLCITPTAEFVPNEPPTIAIAPFPPILDCEGDGENVTLTANANDTEQGDLDLIIVWKDGTGTEVGTGPTLNLVGFTGSDTYTAEVTDATPATASASILVDVLNDAPVLADVAANPSGGAEGVEITFTATATDEEDEDTSLTVSWSSNLDGPLGDRSPLAVTSLNVGTHTITASVTDSCGETTTVDITVEITTNTPPSFVNYISPQDLEEFRDCEGDGEEVILNVNFDDLEDDASTTPLTVEWFNGATSLGTGNPLTVTLQIGLHSLSATATDSDGNSTPAGSSLTVEVLAEPIFVVTSETVGGSLLAGATLSGPGEITVCWATTDIDFGGGEHIHLRLDDTDNGQGNSNPGGGIDPYVRLDAASGCFTFTNVGLGTHVVSLTGAETGHNEICDGQQFAFTVVDDEPPVVDCLDTDPVVLELDANGLLTVTPEMISNSITDNDGIASTTVTPNTFDCGDIGATISVMLTATDLSGNPSSCTVNVSIVDITGPTVTCASDIGVTSLSGLPVSVTITPPSVTDACDTGPSLAGIATLEDTSTFALTDQQAMYDFPVGSTRIDWTATDASGNSGTCVQFVNVGFTPSGDSQITAFTVNGVEGDIVGTNITVLLPASTPLTALVPDIDLSDFASVVPGEVPQDFSGGPVAYTVTAQDGASQTIYNVTANAAPVADAGTDITVIDLDASGDELVDLDGSGSSDEGSIISYVWTEGATEIATGQTPSVTFAVGIHNVVLTVTDNLGGTATDEVVITVNADGNPPSITCPSEPATLPANENCLAILPDYTGAVTATDEDPGVTISQSPVEGTPVADGTVVTFTATDASGNSASCTIIISVEDETPPQLVCPVAQTLQGDLNGELILPDFRGDATISDNCDPSFTVVQSPIPGTTVTGMTQVTITATDADLNSASCSFDLTVTILPPANLVIAPTSMEVTLFVGQSAMVDYVVDSDDASTLPTPAAMTLTDDATSNPPTWAATTSAANQNTTYEVFFDATGLAPGTYTGTLAAGPVTGYGDVSIPITLNVDPVPPLGILEFVLVNADTNTDIAVINEGDVIYTAGLPANLNIEAVATPDTESVQLQLSGTQNQNKNENIAPYALFGDNGGNFNSNNFALGNYTLSATAFAGNNGNGASGDTATVNFSFSDSNPLCEDFELLAIIADDPITCGGTEGFIAVLVDADILAEPLEFNWSHDAGLDQDFAENLPAGTYIVSVTDANGCFDQVTVVLEDPALPIVTLAPLGSVSSTDDPVTLSGMPIIGGTYSGPGVSGNEFDPGIGPGTYTITYEYTDDNGCTNSASQDIQVNPPFIDTPLIVVNADTDENWFALVDGMTIPKSLIGNTPLGIIFNADLNPNGVQFNLSGPINEQRSEGKFPPYSLFGDIGVNIQGQPFPVGLYTLIANPNNGPTQIVNFEVSAIDPECIDFDASISSVSNPMTCGADDGSASISVSGFTGPLTITWSNGGSEDQTTATNLEAGDYSVTVIDANGCTETLNFTLEDPDLPNVTLSSFSDVFIDAPAFTLMGGMPMGGTYSGPGVDNGEFTPADAGAGTHTIVYEYTDGNGCTNEASQDITVIDPTGQNRVVSFSLMDALDGSVIDPVLEDNEEIDGPAISVNIRANTSPVNVGSVQFILSGELTRNWTENFAPYALYGDSNGTYFPADLPVGAYTLTATPFSLSNGNGEAGIPLTIDFSVIDVGTFNRQTVNPVSVSPNPADRTATLSFVEPTHITDIYLFDVSGKLVKTIKADQGGNVDSYLMRVQDLPQATYYVKIKRTRGLDLQQRVVIKR